jgi:hypothetical protein
MELWKLKDYDTQWRENDLQKVSQNFEEIGVRTETWLGI